MSGAVSTGDTVAIVGQDQRARVRGIHSANRAVDRAVTGERCALNLSGPGIRTDAIGRGDWVTDPLGAATTRRCDVTLRALVPIRHWTPVLLHHGASQIVARVVLLDPLVLDMGGTGLAQLLLDRPAPLRHGDRLVLRDISASQTIAGGAVLDSGAPARHRRREARLAVLRALASPEPLSRLLAEPPFLVSRESLRAHWGVTEPGLPVLEMGGFIASEDGLARLSAVVSAALTGFHVQHPGAPGMTPEALRLSLPFRPPREAMTALIAHLLHSGIIAAESHLLRSPDHRGGLAGEDARFWALLEPLLRAEPTRPPLLKDAATTLGLGVVPLRRACKGFARLGLVVEVAPDRFFLREAVADMALAARALAVETPGGAFTAAAFRDRVACGRQLAIQVLEYLDRRGVTVRRGDLRVAGRAVLLPE